MELRDLLAANALGADAPEAAVAGTALALADVRASARPLQSTGKEGAGRNWGLPKARLPESEVFIRRSKGVQKAFRRRSEPHSTVLL